MMQVPFFDLKRQYQNIEEELKAPMQAVLDDCAFAGGPYTAKFEKLFAEYCAADYAVGVNNGTSALHLALLAMDIGPGDEVILPANTFIATAWAPSYVGATPVFVDCDTYYNIDVAQVQEAITPNTKLIIGVHLYGQPCDIDALKKIASERGIFFLEDAAQAHGAAYNGKSVGALGEMGCFSFYPGKNLGAYGEGGAIVTNNKSYQDRIFSLRNHGSEVRYYHDELGFNMRMDGLQAAVLSVKLKHIDAWNHRRQAIAHHYITRIENEHIQLPQVREEVKSVFHLFVVTVSDRDHFQNYLQSQNIGSALHYPVPCHLQKVYASLGYQKGDFPKSEYLADHCVSLPMFPELSDGEVNRVIEVLNQYKP